ncbi:hypothetical protein DPMN_144279 [Dreissena polymorpha]|uniref:Uncharacterized protein n=1 Tax=Dreissena polymorpha TaxID=45954 RepID=A0A9D4JP14_DREPO|nr:hypothetical protein DPMN_144279 [Dreissena polymorpha]
MRKDHYRDQHTGRERMLSVLACKPSLKLLKETRSGCVLCFIQQANSTIKKVLDGAALLSY